MHLKLCFYDAVVTQGDSIMPLQALEAVASNTVLQPDLSEAEAPLDYPMREYIGGMSRELAEMARRDGDEMLAVQLERASERAAQPAQLRSESAAPAGR